MAARTRARVLSSSLASPAQLGQRSSAIKDLRRGAGGVAGADSVPSPRPVEQMRGRHVTAVAAGGRGLDGGHTAFTVRGEAGDELWLCGHGRWGQLGGKAFTHISEPKLVGTLSRLRQYDEVENKTKAIKILGVACGERHTAAVLETGNVFVWGWNDKGQLGTESSQGTHTPAMLKAPAELRFTPVHHVACGACSTSVWT